MIPDLPVATVTAAINNDKITRTATMATIANIYK